jgi:hypothetical protein
LEGIVIIVVRDSPVPVGVAAILAGLVLICLALAQIPTNQHGKTY